MPRRRHTPEQIITKLAEGQKLLAGGMTVEDVCREFGIAALRILAGGEVAGPDLLVCGPGPADRLFGQEGFLDTCNDVGADAFFSGCEKFNE